MLAETEAEIADDTRIEALELEMIIQQQYNAIQGTCLHVIIMFKIDTAVCFIPLTKVMSDIMQSGFF